MSLRDNRRQRFGHYFLGVGIGCVMVGLMWQMRVKTAARQQQQQNASEQAPTDGTTPPAPALPEGEAAAGEAAEPPSP